MQDKIQAYRQPFITSTGIILGFALNATASWAPKAFESIRISEIFMAIGTTVFIPLFIIVIYRTLNMNYPKEKAESYYNTTLVIFLCGIFVFYLTIVGVMVESFFIYRR
ncbi:MAG TPA: hypothetical protein VMH01_08895 [Puia sp.]|nr:hypothetical protein [Puia sp.]